MNVLSLFKDVKLFVLDVDGVLTNGSLILLGNGEMARTMNIKDGYALQLAIKKGYEVMIISGGASEAVKMRLAKLGITNVHFAVKNKQEILAKFVLENHYTWPQVLYMGDDIPDVLPMQMVGVACAPADAVQEIKSIAHYISPISGGNGCVRDVIEKVLKLNANWNDADNTASI
ncbi:MAG: 3-deoxy-D-manno-octulosonate 8-phosphate phosphatase [Ferruginibacter sp.]|nr:3-deoxy-D-manno-octulosonate 8-phosphate phosphatase [Ferruginibacter sp.]